MAVHDYKVTFRYQDALCGIVENVQHFNHNADDDPGPATILEEIWDAVQTSCRALVPTDSSVVSLHAVQQPLTSTPLVGPPEATKLIGLAGTRALGDRHIDGGMCARATLYTGLAGRSFRGALYFYPCLDGGQISVNGSFWDSAGKYIVLCRSFATALLAVGSGVSWGVYSKTRARLNEANPVNDVTSYVVPNQQYWLRRREARMQ